MEIKIITREHPDVCLENYIVMPPKSGVADRGNNILHINTQNRHYSLNKSASDFVEHILIPQGAKVFKSDVECLKYAVEYALNNDGVLLEFGFCTGTTLNFIAALAFNRTVYGFDSLNGLPGSWRPGFPQNVFSYKDDKKWPFIPLANISLVIGEIEETLKRFVTNYLKDGIAFIHIDTDTYSSAKIIFDELNKHIVPSKTVIVLDEGYNFNDDTRPEGHNEWMQHEYKAITEFASKMNYQIKYLAFNENHQQLVCTFEKIM